jgi:DNA gyrase/topoisomerase IV subunit A
MDLIALRKEKTDLQESIEKLNFSLSSKQAEYKALDEKLQSSDKKINSYASSKIQKLINDTLFTYQKKVRPLAGLDEYIKSEECLSRRMTQEPDKFKAVTDECFELDIYYVRMLQYTVGIMDKISLYKDFIDFVYQEYTTKRVKTCGDLFETFLKNINTLYPKHKVEEMNVSYNKFFDANKTRLNLAIEVKKQQDSYYPEVSKEAKAVLKNIDTCKTIYSELVNLK